MQQGLRLSVKATLPFDTCGLSQEGICPLERESVVQEQSGHLCIIGASEGLHLFGHGSDLTYRGCKRRQ
ncbi:hypothetical protein CapIbe_007582 [Capra ibex]